jgi:hypothetical protein
MEYAKNLTERPVELDAFVSCLTKSSDSLYDGSLTRRR